MAFKSSITRQIERKLKKKENMKKNNAAKQLKAAKTAKTVKVSTLVKIGVSIAVVVSAFVAGTVTANTAHTVYSEAVTSEARQLVEALSLNKGGTSLTKQQK